MLYLDPERGFVGLQGQIPGVEVDISGAGDHIWPSSTHIYPTCQGDRPQRESGTDCRVEAAEATGEGSGLLNATSRKNLKSSGGSTVCPRMKFVKIQDRQKFRNDVVKL